MRQQEEERGGPYLFSGWLKEDLLSNIYRLGEGDLTLVFRLSPEHLPSR